MNTQKISYNDWLYEFTRNQKNQCWDNESIMYDKMYTHTDRNNASKLYQFYEQIKNKAKKQYILPINNEKKEKDKYYFKLKKDFFEIYSLRFDDISIVVRKILNQPNEYVYLDEEIPKKILQQRELIQYIIINKDLKTSKIVCGFHIAQACILATINNIKDTDRFNLWYRPNKSQKIIFLQTDNNTILELSNNFYCIKDIGNDNIPKNSIIAVSLGIMNRKEAERYTNNCTLWE